MNTITKILALGICAALFAAGATVYGVTLVTSPLIGHPSGPFSLDVQFIDGSFAGDGNNSVTISNFSGATPLGTGFISGGVSGSLFSSVTLTDSAPLNLFSQQFMPGALLSFRISYTTNVDAGPTPDQFSVSVLDALGMPLPSTSLATLGIDTFLSVDIDSTSAAPVSYAGDPFRAPFLALEAPTVAQAAIPEPGTMAVVLAGLGLGAALRLRHRS